jgi:hypothetical protein
MKKLILACAIAASATFSLPSFAAPAAAHYSTEDSSIGDLMDNPKTKAILDKYVPGLTSAEQIDAARGMTLKAVQQFAPDTVTDDALAKIDADLAKLPAEK